jgi:alanine racemase
MLQVKMVNQGDCIGYNRTYRASDYIWVATLGVGYADGFSRAFSSGLGGAANCSVMMHYASGGQRSSVACNVIGRVSMDAITVRAGAGG